MTVLKWLTIIILAIIGVIAIFYLIYLIFNKDKSVGFSQYILNITWGKSEITDVVGEDVEDILWDFHDTPSASSDILSDTSKKTDPLGSTTTKAELKSIPVQEEVPDWLKWNFAEDTPKALRKINWI